MQNSKPWLENYRLFTAREYESELDLYYYRSRYYDAKIGKFTSRDPLLYVDGPNVYTYVNNNPVNYVDQWGLSSKGLYPDHWSPAVMTEANIPWYEQLYLNIKHYDTVQRMKNNVEWILWKDFVDWAIKWDYNQEQNISSIAGQTIVWFTPAGVAWDIRDFSYQWKNGSTSDIIIAGVAFVPWLGDIAKWGYKLLKNGAKLTNKLSFNQIQKLIEKGNNVPKWVERLDWIRLNPWEQPHIHINGWALNIDWTRKHNPKKPLSNADKQRLKQIWRGNF